MTPVHVNVPYSMLVRRTEFALRNRIHPEIYFCAQDLESCDDQEVRSLAETLRREDLETSLHAPFMDLSPGGVDRRVKEVTLDRFSKTLQLGRFFNPTTIVFHPGYEKWKFDGNVKVWLESSLDTWRPLVREAEQAGLVLAIENVFEERPDSLRDLLEQIQSLHFRFCFDTGHHHLFSKVPLQVWIETLGGYLAEVHLHDNHREMDEHLPIGEGGFDFGGLFDLLSRSALHPVLTIEPHQEAHLWRGLQAIQKYLHPNVTTSPRKGPAGGTGA